MKLVPCVAWVAQGVAAKKPQKVRVDKDELAHLLQGASADTSEGDDGDDDQHQSPPGLRGSNPTSENEAEEKDDDPLAKYKLDNYDSDDEETKGGTKGAHMRGIACHAAPVDDLFIADSAAGADVSSDEDDKDDFLVQPTDNLVLVAKIVKDEYNLEVWIYNESDNDFYVHHDFMLEHPPLCVTPICYDPGNEEGGFKGNLCAIGDMTSVVSIWDLDLVDCLTPVVVLGDAARDDPPNKKRKQPTDGSNKSGHVEAVLDVRWNRLTEHVLASAGADSAVLLWDLEIATVASRIESHEAKVQSLDWHPVESSLLLSADCAGRILLSDCRTEQPSADWPMFGAKVEVEKVRWNPLQPFHFVATTSTGVLSLFDSRRPSGYVWKTDAAAGVAVSALSLSGKLKNALVTGSDEGILKLWKVNDGSSAVEKVGEIDPKLGKIHSVEFSPNTGTSVAVGGDKGDYVRIINLNSFCDINDNFATV